MSKKKRRQKRKKQPATTKKQSVMTQQNVSDVVGWLGRMNDNVAKAVELSQQLTLDTLTEENDLFWALVKYVENAQESAKQIDNINRGLFSELIEFDQRYWKALRGMRDRLAHKFWDIDPNILLETVKKDFVQLLPLLSTLHLHDQIVGNNGKISFTVNTDRLLNLPNWQLGSDAKAGYSFVVVAFKKTGDVMVFRYGHDGIDKLTTSSNSPGELRVYGLPKHPQ